MLKKILATLGLIFIFIGLFLIKKDDIFTIFNDYVLKENKVVTIGEKNEYYRDYDFNFVKNTNNFFIRVAPPLFSISRIIISFFTKEVKHYWFSCPARGVVSDLSYIFHHLTIDWKSLWNTIFFCIINV